MSCPRPNPSQSPPNTSPDGPRNPPRRSTSQSHKTRLARTLEITPPGGPDDRILEMGAYLQITPALRTRLGYGTVRGCYYGPAGEVDHRSVVSTEGETFACDIDLFDAEKDRFPYADDYFSTVLCGELIEHLFHDPMHLMSEVNRILKPGGHLVLTTPNLASLRGDLCHPAGLSSRDSFTAYIRPAADGETDARHNREYTPLEIHQLLENSGFSVARLETGPFRDEPTPEYAWVVHLLERYHLDHSLRGEGIYAVGRKTGAVRERYPGVAVHMTARLSNAEVRADNSRSVTASFEIRNVSKEPWRPADGFAVGYHIFDPETDTLVVDGPRAAPEADIAPGESRRFEIALRTAARAGPLPRVRFRHAGTQPLVLRARRGVPADG